MFHVFFDLLNQPWPTLAVTIQRLGLSPETTMRNFDFRSGGCGRQFPTHNGDAGGIVMPIRRPGKHQQVWRLEFQNLASMIKPLCWIALALTWLGERSPQTAHAQIHF